MRFHRPRAPPLGAFKRRPAMAEKQSVMSEILQGISEKAAQWRAEQPSVLAEMKGTFREGREDAWNNLIPAFPSASPVREAGAPGSPTQAQTTAALTGEEIAPQSEDLAQEMARMQGNEQSRGR
jgi:hypothetical protein